MVTDTQRIGSPRAGDITELVLGAGTRPTKAVNADGRDDWSNPTKLDINPDTNPDVVFDLDLLTTGGRLPFPDDSFDEIHAYEVLEHIGTQGDYVGFFNQFAEFWRVLKPDGLLCGSVPLPTSVWAWGDPGHRRVIPVETFVFLDQERYVKHLSVTPMSDYRSSWTGDFVVIWSDTVGDTQLFALKARKVESAL